MKVLKIVITVGLLASTGSVQARPYETSGNSGRDWCEVGPDHSRLIRFFVWFIPCPNGNNGNGY